jgi:hypothetical protein
LQPPRTELCPKKMSLGCSPFTHTHTAPGKVEAVPFTKVAIGAVAPAGHRTLSKTKEYVSWHEWKLVDYFPK